MEIKLQNADWLNFFELNISGNNEHFNKCDPESKYLDGEVFSLFAPCFERSNSLFDYFGPTKYDSRSIVPLQNELKDQITEMEALQSLDEFKSFVKKTFMGSNFLIELEKIDPQWTTNWEKYRDSACDTVNEIILLIDRCLEEERVLWVIGY